MTLEEIAADLGVSKSTVSRALSGKGRIGEETRDKIIKYVGEQRDEIKRRKQQACTHNIGVVLPTDVYRGGGAFFQDCLLGICEAASYYDYNVLITTGNMQDLYGIQAMVDNQRVDGIILTRTLEDDRYLEYLSNMHFPTALTGSCKYDEIIQVDTDNEAAAEKLTSLLVSRGYRKFALLVKDMNFSVDRSRHDGFCKALLKCGIPDKDQIFYSGKLKMEFLDSIIGNLTSKKVECVVCGDDEVCTMVTSKLQAEGFRIPRDIAVASLYNSSNLDCFSPAVTAVSVAASKVGNSAGKQIIQYLQGKPYEKKTMIDYDILFRKSTR